MYRQGDVLIVRIDEIPEGAKKAPNCVLALGEATGHKHEIRKGAVQLLLEKVTGEVKERLQFLRVTAKQATLQHEEHAALTIPQGSYQVLLQREYTPEAVRRVAD